MWDNFKLDFTAVHQKLRDTDATIDELGFISANSTFDHVVSQLRAEVPHESESETVMITPLLLSENLPTVNATQSTSYPVISTLMASMMASMEVVCVQLEESYIERRDGGR